MSKNSRTICPIDAPCTTQWGNRSPHYKIGLKTTRMHQLLLQFSPTVLKMLQENGMPPGLGRLIVQLKKEEGWSFAYMGSAHNVKEVTNLLSIEIIVTKSDLKKLKKQ